MTLTPDQVLIAHIAKALTLFALVGILWHGRARLCWSFVGYLFTGLICDSLYSFWPEYFFKPWFWILQQGLDDALKMAIAVELGFRIFQAFPTAQATARRLLFILLIATSLALIGIPIATSFKAIVVQWQPRVLTGTIWLMNGLALLITWYRVPVHAYHKAILMGFVPYLVVFTTLLTLLGSHESLLRVIQSLQPAAYAMMVGYWMWAAWKPETQPDVSAAVIRFLQPWRKVASAKTVPAQSLQPGRA